MMGSMRARVTDGRLKEWKILDKRTDRRSWLHMPGSKTPGLDTTPQACIDDAKKTLKNTAFSSHFCMRKKL